MNLLAVSFHFFQRLLWVNGINIEFKRGRYWFYLLSYPAAAAGLPELPVHAAGG